MGNLALFSLTAEQVNSYSSKGMLTKADLVEWCLCAGSNHLSVEWYVGEDYNLRGSVRYSYPVLRSRVRRLNDEDC